MGEDTGGNVGGNIVGSVGNIGNVGSTIGSNIGNVGKVVRVNTLVPRVWEKILLNSDTNKVVLNWFYTDL